MGVKKDMDLNRERYIYYIICPISSCVVYVGITNSAMSRFKGHMNKAKKGGQALIHFYIRFLISQKKTPKFKVVSKVFSSYTKSEFIEARHTEMHLNTVFNEMYGNGKSIEKNKTLKKKFKNKELNYIEYFKNKTAK
jgi:hypothetical protein